MINVSREREREREREGGREGEREREILKHSLESFWSSTTTRVRKHFIFT